MTLSELLFLMADANRKGVLENLAEGWFPDDGPADFVFGTNSAFYFGAHGERARKAAMVRLAGRYVETTRPPPDLLVQGSRTARIASASDIVRSLETSSNDDPTIDDPKDVSIDPDRALSFYVRRMEGKRRSNLPTSSYFSCLVDGAGYPSAGVLQRHDNYEHVASDPATFVADFVSICQELRSFYAVSGFSLLTTSFSSYKSVRNYPIFKRFPGLLYWNSLHAAPHGDRSDDWVLDANWLTAVNDDMLKRLGGYDTARAALGTDVVMHRFDGGVVFQAGPTPRIGDANEGDIPSAYRDVTRIIRPLRYPNWASLDYVLAPEPIDDRDATHDWIARFD